MCVGERVRRQVRELRGFSHRACPRTVPVCAPLWMGTCLCREPRVCASLLSEVRRAKRRGGTKGVEKATMSWSITDSNVSFPYLPPCLDARLGVLRNRPLWISHCSSSSNNRLLCHRFVVLFLLFSSHHHYTRENVCFRTLVRTSNEKGAHVSWKHSLHIARSLAFSLVILKKIDNFQVIGDEHKDRSGATASFGPVTTTNRISS